MRQGFRKVDLKPRYDVPTIQEDEWHSHSEDHTNELVQRELSASTAVPRRILNAGCGARTVSIVGFQEVRVDLFVSPLKGAVGAVCGSINHLPFASNSFGCAVCVGEVLDYCDPASAISEFARVLAPDGALILDFCKSTSIRHLFTPSFARAADMIVDQYNGTPEKIWIYHPKYIHGLLENNGFVIKSQETAHRWSALLRRIGFSPKASVLFEKICPIRAPALLGDLQTIVAVRAKAYVE